jgi:hypothetical protein
MVQHLTVYTTKAKPKWLFGAHDRDSARRARCFDFLANRALRRLIHCKWGSVPHNNNGKPTGVTGWRERQATTPRRGRVFFSIGETTPMSHHHGMILYGGCKSDKKFQSSVFLFSLRIRLSFLRVCTVAKSPMRQTGKPGCITALRGYPD